jgi:ribosomal protein L5
MFAFKKKNRINNDEIKEVLYKSMFNSSVHSKIIRQSAKKSSEDQKKLIKQYDELKEIASC